MNWKPASLVVSRSYIYYISLICLNEPFIEQNYKVNTTRTLIGQSLGGLLGAEILFKKPTLFTNYIIVSPSLWWDDESLLAWEPKGLDATENIYISVGKEGEVMERVAKALYEKLNAIKPSQTRLFYEFFEKQSHGDALHLSVYDAFEKIFKKEGE